MKKMIVFVLVICFMTGLAFAKDFDVTKKAGDYDVIIKIDKNPPATGKNNITAEIKDAAGKAVTDAKVIVDYSMPAMPGMPAMNYKANAKLSGSIYKATMDLSMGGSWNIAVKITRGGKTVAAKFNIDVQ